MEKKTRNKLTIENAKCGSTYDRSQFKKKKI